MKTNIVVTGILKDKDLFLIIKRNENDELYPGAWEFPGGHLEEGETIEEALNRELNEEIGFSKIISPIITHYTDEVKEKNGTLIYNLEIDFVIEVDKELLDIKLSKEHTDYKWATKDSEYLDDYIKDKLKNVN